MIIDFMLLLILEINFIVYFLYCDDVTPKMLGSHLKKGGTGLY